MPHTMKNTTKLNEILLQFRVPILWRKSTNKGIIRATKTTKKSKFNKLLSNIKFMKIPSRSAKNTRFSWFIILRKAKWSLSIFLNMPLLLIFLLQWSQRIIEIFIWRLFINKLKPKGCPLTCEPLGEEVHLAFKRLYPLLLGSSKMVPLNSQKNLMFC